jgi:hypothetical protein
VGASCPVTDHVRAYCAENDGMWRLDQAQRLVEQAAAMLVDRDSLTALLDYVRGEYRRWLGSTCLESEGTVRVEPACGVVPATTTFGMAALLPDADTGLSHGWLTRRRVG